MGADAQESDRPMDYNQATRYAAAKAHVETCQKAHGLAVCTATQLSSSDDAIISSNIRELVQLTTSALTEAYAIYDAVGQ